jgi:hypothetical protein
VQPTPELISLTASEPKVVAIISEQDSSNIHMKKILHPYEEEEMYVHRWERREER